MDEEQLEALFRAAFTEAFVRKAVAALSRAYDAACERHAPDEGGNAQTFGFCTYHYGVYQLTRELADGVDARVYHRRVFRMNVGNYEVGCYRIGSTENDDVNACFPHNDGAAGGLVEGQLWLSGISKTQGVEKSRKVILGHLGNPEDGLRALYACVPGKKDGDRIAEWAYTLPLWRADQDAFALPPTVAAPEETIEAPDVEFRELIAEDVAPEEVIDPPSLPLTPVESEDEEEG